MGLTMPKCSVKSSRWDHGVDGVDIDGVQVDGDNDDDTRNEFIK